MSTLSRIVFISALLSSLYVGMVAAATTPLERGIAALQRNDLANAIKILKPLAVRGDVQAQYYLGLSYEYRPEAVAWFKKASEQGHAKAQYFLYSFYRDGMGVEQNPLLANQWLNKAAVGGSDSAQYSLGIESGDPKWFRLAAAQGHDGAQLALASLYRDGKGVERDFVRAYMWLYLAAEAGNATAKEKRTYAEKQVLTPQEITQGRALAQRCKQSGFKHCD